MFLLLTFSLFALFVCWMDFVILLLTHLSVSGHMRLWLDVHHYLSWTLCFGYPFWFATLFLINPQYNEDYQLQHWTFIPSWVAAYRYPTIFLQSHGFHVVGYSFVRCTNESGTAHMPRTRSRERGRQGKRKNFNPCPGQQCRLPKFHSA